MLSALFVGDGYCCTVIGRGVAVLCLSSARVVLILKTREKELRDGTIQ